MGSFGVDKNHIEIEIERIILHNNTGKSNHVIGLKCGM